MTLMQDVRYAARQLRKTPGFTLTAVLTLALGIGANAAIFTLVNAVLLKNLPVTDPKMLVRVGDEEECCIGNGTHDNGHYSMFSTETWLDMQRSAPEFEQLAAMQAGFRFNPITVRRNGDSVPRSMVGEYVSGNYFETFGLRPDAGRLMADRDDAPGAPLTAVMSYETWERQYNGDPSVVGSTFWINTKAVTVVGIAPKGFYGDRLENKPPELYLPIQSIVAVSNVPVLRNNDLRWLYVIGRVKPGVSLPALQQKLSAVLRVSLAPTESFTGEKTMLANAHVVLTPAGGGIQRMQQQYDRNLYLLMTLSGLVLLIACANIANLLLVRGMARKTEMSLRSALGAMRGRLVRQLLTESVVLSLLGGAAGLLVAYAGARALLALAFTGARTLPIDASPSAAVLGFAFGLALLTGVLFGVAPAWIAARTQPADVLRSGSRTTAARASLLQRGLVVLQAALSLVLLVGAGLFAQSLSNLEHTNMHLDAKNRYIAHINVQGAGYQPSQVASLYRAIEDRFDALPGVVRVGDASSTPMEDGNWGGSVQVQGQPALQDNNASLARVSPEYFAAVGTPLAMGRGILDTDTASAPTVAVVNKSFVKKFFGGGNPIGQHFGGDAPTAGDIQIVGVVEDTAYRTVRWTDHAMYFIALTQRPVSDKDPIDQDRSLYSNAIVIQTARPMDNMEELTRRTLASINPNLTVAKFQTFDAQIADRFNDDRLIARLTMVFGALALLLAAVGLYGVTAYTVARRTSEIGIRMALGAERKSVVAMVMRGAMMQALLGLGIGIPVAYVCVRFVKAQLYEITNADATVMVGAILTLALAACVAGLIPARRAASIDPMQALRTE